MLTRRIVTSVCALSLAIPATAAAAPPAHPLAEGPYGISSTTGPPATAKAKGPYGVTPATGLATVAAATAHPAATPRSDDTAAWRIVALCEAALLAAFALAAAHLVPRRRAPRLVT